MSGGAKAGAGAGAGIFGLIVCAVVTRYVLKKPGDVPSSSAPVPPAVGAPRFVDNPGFHKVPGRARLNVTGRDATLEMHNSVTFLSPEEKFLLGEEVLRTGIDTYAASIRMTNTGTVPIRVFPQNLSVHFGGESAIVTVVNHPRFLTSTVLAPGTSIEGLVLYQARVDIGAAMRSGRGGLSYDDRTIDVTYTP